MIAILPYLGSWYLRLCRMLSLEEMKQLATRNPHESVHIVVPMATDALTISFTHKVASCYSMAV